LYKTTNNTYLYQQMGIVQKDAFRTMLISYLGIVLGYLNKGLLFILILTTEQIGLINLLVSVGLLFAQFANLGTVYTTWKFLPYFRNEAKKHNGFLYLMLLIVAIGICLCSLLAVWYKPEIARMYAEHSPLFVQYYFWIIPIGIAYVLFLLFEIYLRSFFINIISVVAFEIGLRVIVMMLLLLVYLKAIDFETFLISHSIAYLIPVIVLLVFLFRAGHLDFKKPQISISKRFRKIIFLFSGYNYLNTLGAVLVSSLDVMMIAQFLGLTATGVYTTVVFLANAIQVPYKAIIRIASPLVAEHWRNKDVKQMHELYEKVSSVALLIGLASFLLLWVNIDFMFSFLRPEFQPGKWVFFFLMIGKLVDMYFGLNGPIFITSKKYKYDIFFTLFLIISVFVMNMWFIPMWGIAGAAISTSIALIIYNVGRIIFVYAIFRIHPFTANQFIMMGQVIVIFGIIYMVGTPLYHPVGDALLRTLIAAALFFGPVYWLKLEPETVNYLNNGIRFVRGKLSKSH
jgi:O-antigen/teichoic acid export membrane protein